VCPPTGEDAERLGVDHQELMAQYCTSCSALTFEAVEGGDGPVSEFDPDAQSELASHVGHMCRLSGGVWASTMGSDEEDEDEAMEVASEASSVSDSGPLTVVKPTVLPGLPQSAAVAPSQAPGITPVVSKATPPITTGPPTPPPCGPQPTAGGRSRCFVILDRA